MNGHSSFAPRGHTTIFMLLAAGLVPACSGGKSESTVQIDPAIATETQAVLEDGLADAYANFVATFTSPTLKFDKRFPIGAGYHPGLSTEKLPGGPVLAKITIDRTLFKVTATLHGAPSNQEFDLWFVKNSNAAGKTVRPESGDTFLPIDTFAESNGVKTIDKVIGNGFNDGVRFDLDLVVVTRKNQHPTVSRILVGARSLFEKRYFRTYDEIPFDTVSGTLDNTVETTDPLVRRGAHLFNNETFGGNGRVCASCHPVGNNLTIDPKFIATLPASDPLFVFERVPALAELESPFLRSRALFRENTDGLDAPPVLRSANHTFTLGLTVDISQARNIYPVAPPEQFLGWGGDGAPGRGTLNEFSFGAIIQHFPKTLNRKPGDDFRIPTQQELDALEAFQLFTGRQKPISLGSLRFRDTAAEEGRVLASPGGAGKCAECHHDMLAQQTNTNLNFNNGAALRATGLPVDDGFKQPFTFPMAEEPFATLGDGNFNTPPIIEAADTTPLFHNNSAATIEDAVQHYTTDAFTDAIDGGRLVGPITLSPDQIAKIAIFLREINAAENLRQIKKRVLFVKNNRSPGNTAILGFAIRDTQDAISDLADKNLNAAAQHDLATIKQTLIIAQAVADADRSAFMDNAIVWIDRARGDILLENPYGDF